MNVVVRTHAVCFFAYDRTGKGLASRPAGAGTLIDFHGIRGIVTAAHVASKVQTIRDLGIATFGIGKYEALNCQGDDLEVTTIGASLSPSEGPDLAFVRVPIRIEERLAASHAYFSSAQRARLQQLGHTRSSTGPIFLTGIVAELSESLGIRGASAHTRHASLNGIGRIEAVQLDDRGIDRITFRVTHNEKLPAPKSYEGLSGGGLWMLGEGTDILSRTLIGVAYYQSEVDEKGVRLISCHGPLSIFETLYLAVLDRYLPTVAADHRSTSWPDGPPTIG